MKELLHPEDMNDEEYELYKRGFVLDINSEETSNVVLGKQCHLDKHTLILKEKSRKCYKAIKA